jgi:hypothetical protein
MQNAWNMNKRVIIRLTSKQFFSPKRLRRNSFTKRGNFTSLDDLRNQMLAFIDYYNRTMAKPIKWTYAGLDSETISK